MAPQKMLAIVVNIAVVVGAAVWIAVMYYLSNFRVHIASVSDKCPDGAVARKFWGLQCMYEYDQLNVVAAWLCCAIPILSALWLKRRKMI